MDLSMIRIIAYDFDGVMTDNNVYVDQDGKEMVRVNRGDGLAIALFKEKGLMQLILSTERNTVVKARADKLKIECLHGVIDKRDALCRFIEDSYISLEEVMYVGNDINDLEVMEVVGMPVAPNDAHPKILRIAKIITRLNGGEGVIRELYDIYDGGGDEIFYKRNNK